MLLKNCLFISLIILYGSIGAPFNSKAQSQVSAKNDTARYFRLLKQIHYSQDSLRNIYNSLDDSAKIYCIKSAEQYLIETYYKKIIPAWLSTKWEFYGETQIPGDSSIACGYFVITTLKQLGCRLEHSHEMATNYSAYMVNSLCDTSYKVYKPLDLLQIIKTKPDDIWVVGLKNHSALIVKYKGKIRFVHSSYFSPTMVIDESIEGSETFNSSTIYVAGNLFENNSLTEKWIKGEEVKYTKKY